MKRSKSNAWQSTPWLVRISITCIFVVLLFIVLRFLVDLSLFQAGRITASFGGGILILLLFWWVACRGVNGNQDLWLLVQGADGLPSTSKVQWFLWTVVALFAYTIVFVSNWAEGHWGTPNPIAVPPKLAAAMGLSSVTMVAAKAITNTFVATGKLMKPGPVFVKSRWIALFADDNGSPDLSKVQLLAWTLIGVASYLLHLLYTVYAADKVLSLPDVDLSLLTLLGLGQGAYVGKKLFTTTQANAIGPNGDISVLGPANFPTIFAGKTDHFNVYYDADLKSVPNIPSIAQGVLAICEVDFAKLLGYFQQPPPGLPFNVILMLRDSTGNGLAGAVHQLCTDTTIFCDIRINPPDAELSSFLLAMEATEVFASAFHWDCMACSGEGLSRVMGTLCHPGELGQYATAAQWLDSNRPNFVDVNFIDDNGNVSDANNVANGCAVLFLNYLHHARGFAWSQIVQAGAETLAAVYTELTGETDAWDTFSTEMARLFPPGRPSGLVSDNPYQS